MKKDESQLKEYWKGGSEKYLSSNNYFSIVCYVGMPSWFNKFIDTFQKRAFKKLIKNLSINQKRVLDIGCGLGRWSSYFVNESKRVDGIDIDKARIQTLKKHFLDNKKINFVCTSASRLPFEANTFDVINSITVLQHIPFDSKLVALDEIERVAKTNSHVLIVELSDLSDDANHVFPFSQQKWVDEFFSRGFEVRKKIGYEYIPLIRFARYLKKRISGSSSLKKDYVVNMSLPEKVVLWILVWLSYPLEVMCEFIVPSKYARHIGLLLEKVK